MQDIKNIEYKIMGADSSTNLFMLVNETFEKMLSSLSKSDKSVSNNIKSACKKIECN